MYDDTAALITSVYDGYDIYGNPKKTATRRTVYVQPRGVYSSEFYNAAQAGMKPSITFELAVRADYNNEDLIEYKGVLYKIIRVDWNAQRDKLSLICEQKVKATPDWVEESES